MDRLIKYGLIFLGLLLILVAFASLGWRFQHDSPILLYIAFLIERFGCVPYRDIFDMNMPGMYLAYWIIGRFSGYTASGVRFADLLILSGMLAMTWLWMRRLGSRTAWCGCILWGLMYLAAGPMTSLQREYLLLLPVAAGLFAHSALETHRLRQAVVGLLFGVAATMKPQAAIGFPLLLLFDLRGGLQPGDPGLREPLRRVALPAILGFGLPVSCVLVYLWLAGTLASFVDIVVRYLPLYGSLSGWHETLSGVRRAWYLVENYRTLGGFGLWIAPAAVGTYFALCGSSLSDGSKRQVRLLLGLAALYSVYPVFSGQFWPYHWLPFLYFLMQLASLCLVAQPMSASRSARLFPPLVFALAMAAALPLHPVRDALAGSAALPLGGRVDEMAAFLKQNLSPGDTVQPLDWTGGAVHAMLTSEARIATPFIYDFHFYHHVSTDYIQGLRRRFLADMARARPRFILNVFGNDKPWVWGADTTRDFYELQLILSAGYRVVLSGNGYTIHQRIAE